MYNNMYPYVTQFGVPPHTVTEQTIPERFSNSNTYLATNPGYGPAADVNMQDSQGSSLAAGQIQTFANPNDVSSSGTQNLAQIFGVYPSSGTFHQHQSMPHESTQELIAGGYSDGANGNAGPMTPGTFGDTNSDSRALTLHWKRADGTQAQAQVQATDPVYDSLTRTCSPDLQLILVGAGIRSVDIQSLLRDKHTPVTRIKYVPGENNRDFDELVKSLRNRGGFAIAGCDVSGKAQLLFAPLYMDLLCASFPTGIPKLWTPHSRGSAYKKRHVTEKSKRSSSPAPVPDSVAMPSSPEQPHLNAVDGTQNPQPQRRTQPQADYPPPEAVEHGHPQGDPNLLVPCSPVAAVTPVRAASSPHLQPEPQADTQGPLEPSQTQQSLEVASQDMDIADNELGGLQTDTDTDPDSPMPTGSASPISMLGNDVWFGVGEDNANHAYTDHIFYGGDPFGSYASSSLGGGEDGAMRGVAIEATPSPTPDSGAWRFSDEPMF